MNSYNPKIHHRRSIRLKGYDYSQAGLYFITICVQDRKHLFGKIKNGAMIMNDAGRMVTKWYFELENKFPDKKCHEMVVMPNHFHCIIETVITVGADLRVCPDTGPDNNTAGIRGVLGEQRGPGECGEPTNQILGEPTNQILGEPGEHRGPGESVEPTNQILGEPGEHRGPGESGESANQIPVEPTNQILGEPTNQILGEHVGSPLRGVVQWFKTMSTNEYIRGVKQLGWQSFNGKLWQRNYYEHIVRDEQSYQRISRYIVNNPGNWNNDKLHKQ